MSLKTAARKLLARRKNPMSVAQIIQTLADRGMWSPKTGKTPKATLLAILHGELAKGADSTFKRVTYVERGRRGTLWTVAK